MRRFPGMQDSGDEDMGSNILLQRYGKRLSCFS